MQKLRTNWGSMIYFFGMRRECFSGSPRNTSLPQNRAAANAEAALHNARRAWFGAKPRDVI
jgi:hypothetical protein